MSEFIKCLHKKHDLAVSTDIVGLSGNPKFAKMFWELCFKEIGKKPRIGIEYLSWSRLKLENDKGFKDADLDVDGFHGLTGDDRNFYEAFLDTTKLKIVSSLITGTEKLMEIANQVGGSREKNKQVYVLTHEPEAASKLEVLKKKLKDEKYKNVVWAIENHPSKGSFERTIKIVQVLRQAGIKAEFVFDVVHYFRELDETKTLTYVQKWHLLLKALKIIQREFENCIMHLPLGLLEFDSLKIESITNTMWKDLGSYMKDMNNFPVVEHQLVGIDQLAFHPYLREVQGLTPPKKIIQRASGILEVLIKNEVLRLKNAA